MIFILNNMLKNLGDVPGTFQKDDVIAYNSHRCENPSTDLNRWGKVIDPDWFTNPAYTNHSHIQLMKPVLNEAGDQHITRVAVRQRYVSRLCVDIRTGEEINLLLQVLGSVILLPPGPENGPFNYPIITKE